MGHPAEFSSFIGRKFFCIKIDVIAAKIHFRGSIPLCGCVDCGSTCKILQNTIAQPVQCYSVEIRVGKNLELWVLFIGRSGFYSWKNSLD